MVGILFELAISWALLYFLQKEHINALGFITQKKNYFYSLAGFILMAILCVGQQFFESAMVHGNWVLNNSFNWPMFTGGFFQDFKSVAFEELIFRGAFLFILISKIGENKAVLISAAAFGVYHWFSYGILGMVMPMIVIFLGTGLMGYAWAKAFAKTGSILVPFAMHLGWNFIYNSFFSKGPYGEMLFTLDAEPTLLESNQLLFTFTSMILIPCLVILCVSKGLKRQKHWK